MTRSTWREPGDFLYQRPGVMVQEMIVFRDDHDCGCEQGDDTWMFDSPSFEWTSMPDPEDDQCEWCGDEHGAPCPLTAFMPTDVVVQFATTDQKEMEETWNH